MELCIPDIKAIKVISKFYGEAIQLVSKREDFLNEKGDPDLNDKQVYSSTLGESIPLSTDKFCWYCRHPFSTNPLGCPIRYYSSYQNKDLASTFSKEMTKHNFKHDSTDFFETEGCFCSLSCIKAYIFEQKNDPLYKESLTLLFLLQKKLFGTNYSIISSPSWKMLSSYGGTMNIEEFRKETKTYAETINFKRPYLFCMFRKFEEI